MSFVLPTFNLTCGIWNPPFLYPAGAHQVVPCNLAFSKRVAMELTYVMSPTVWPMKPMYLLLPALTNINGRFENGGPMTTVEVPFGSGRVYGVIQVDDIGKGFPNEHRCAIIVQNVAWPMPIP